jgi:oxalate decarboxylase
VAILHAAQGRVNVFFNGAQARTAVFVAGGAGYTPRTLGRYVENTGDTDLIFLEVFRSDRYQDLSLSHWIAHTPPELVMAHLGISQEMLASIPKDKVNLAPV